MLTFKEELTPDFGYCLNFATQLIEIQSAYQHLEVFSSNTFGNVLILDGSFQCSELDEFIYHEALVHPAMCFHKSPQSILLIGGGDGGACKEIYKHPNLKNVTHVEIDECVIKVAKKYLSNVNQRFYEIMPPNYQLILSDAIDYLQHSSQRFDVIILDLTDQGGPSHSLYSEDFYRSCQEHLVEGGIISLHIASPFLQKRQAETILRALNNVFETVLPYHVNIPMSGGHWLMTIATDISFECESISHCALSLKKLNNLKLLNPAYLKSMFVHPNYMFEFLKVHNLSTLQNVIV